MDVALFNNKLKYYFENYKEYYYLPEEDMAIHKSLAIYVDKKFRVKATPTTSYTYVELDTILKSPKDFNNWLNSLYILPYLIIMKKTDKLVFIHLYE